MNKENLSLDSLAELDSELKPRLGRLSADEDRNVARFFRYIQKKKAQVDRFDKLLGYLWDAAVEAYQARILKGMRPLKANALFLKDVLSFILPLTSWLRRRIQPFTL